MQDLAAPLPESDVGSELSDNLLSVLPLYDLARVSAGNILLQRSSSTVSVASEIERALYFEYADRVSDGGKVGEHCILAIGIERDQQTDSDVIQLRVTPWDREYSASTVATFHNAVHIRYQQTTHDPEEMELPWEIVGFYSQAHVDGQRSFRLNCNCCRWAWGSDWPSIERSG